MTVCTPICWESYDCTSCKREVPPRGRSVPIPMADAFCQCDSASSPRHLWNEHDSDRAYVDSEGWAAHVASCSRCAGES